MQDESLEHGDLADQAVLEYFSSIDSGRAFNVEAWLERYAIVRHELLDFLDDQALACSDNRLPTPSVRLTAADLEATIDFQAEAVSSSEKGRSWESHASSVDLGKPPTSVGGIRLGRLLGAGGMGRVYEGRDAANQPVAVKLLAPGWASSAESIARFRKEGALASVMNHPRCVFIRAADTDDGIPFIVMELMPGDTLKDLVAQRGPLPFREAVNLVLDVAEGLEEAHSRGMIHRDVKPANCYMEANGRVKIGDFGLARSVVEGSELTVTGGFVGTPLYASPEQIRGKPLDARTDIYSLAATLFFLLTGRAPFASDHATQTIARIVSEDPPSARDQVPNVPPGIDVALSKGLARDADARFQTIGEFRNALLPFVADGPVSAPLGVRLSAMLVDIGIFTLSMTLVLALYQPRELFMANAKTSWYITMSPPLWFVYLFLAEWRGGATLGKRLFHLRVVDANTLEHPAWYRHFVRSAAFVLVTGYLLQLGMLLSDTEDSAWSMGIYTLGPFLGYALMLVTYRWRNERALLHEWLSGSRTVTHPEMKGSGPALDIRSEWSKRGTATAALAEVPTRIGRFEVMASLSDSEDRLNTKQVLLARDPQLERNVWLVAPPNGKMDDAPLEPTAAAVEELSQSRTTRLRLVEQVRNEESEWDAFIAVDGESLEQIIARRAKWNWAQVRRLLEQFAAEWTASERAGRALHIASLSQLWIDQRGRLILLDFPLNPIAPPAVPPIEPLEVANAMARGLLKASNRDENDSLPPLPVHAIGVLHRLAGDDTKRYEQAIELQRDLQRTQPLATSVGLKHRIVQIALLAIVLSGVYGAGFSLSRLTNQVGIINAGDALLTASYARRMHREETLYEEWTKHVVANPGQLDVEHLPAQDRLPNLADALDQKFAGEYKLRFQHATVFQRVMFEYGPYRAELLEECDQLAWEPPAEDGTTYRIRGDEGSTDIDSGLRFATLTARSMASDLIAATEPRPTWPRRAWAMVLFSIFPVLIVALWDWLFRGGWSAWFAGIRYIDGMNRPVGFGRFALRSLLLWSPVVGLGAGISVLDMQPIPWQLQAADILYVFYQLLPFPYAMLTLLYPQRGWHDRLTGTYPVPR